MPGRPQMRLRSTALLRELMRDRHHDTVSLAAAVGLSKQVISYLWSGRRQTCSRRTAQLVADALGVEVGALFSVPVSSDSPDKEDA